jgi:hypothetical protein
MRQCVDHLVLLTSTTNQSAHRHSLCEAEIIAGVSIMSDQKKRRAADDAIRVLFFQPQIFRCLVLIPTSGPSTGSYGIFVLRVSERSTPLRQGQPER